jgi:UbiD family decarboxylase
MAYQDLRTYLDALAKEGQLIQLKDPVLPEPDISAAACAVNKLGETAPALLFDNIQGYTDARIAMNVHGSWYNHALMLGMPKETPLKEQFHEFVRRYETYPGVVDERETAPWQEVVVDKDINLFDILPLFRLTATAASISTRRASCRVMSPIGTIPTHRMSGCIAFR